ncbi:hypothetical protein ACP275_01G066200 [Erythranthe tilingii]
MNLEGSLVIAVLATMMVLTCPKVVEGKPIVIPMDPCDLRGCTELCKILVGGAANLKYARCYANNMICLCFTINSP